MRTASFCLVVVVAFLLLAFQVRAADLSDEEVAVLPALNNKAVQQCLAFAVKVEAWRQKFQEIKTKLENTGSGQPLPPEVAAAWKSLQTEIVAELKSMSPQLRAAATKITILEQKLTQAIAQAKSDLQTLRDEVAAIEAEVEAARNVLNNPAQYAKNFLEQELIAKYANQPYKAGDFSFKFRKVDPAQSLFSAEAQTEILIEYQEGITLTARGLYFEYKSGQTVPEPRLDKVTVDGNAMSALSGVALKTLGSAGDSIPDLGLPIKVKNVTINPFTPGTERPGALKFDIAIGGILDFAESFQAEAKGVVLETNGKLTMAGGLRFFDNTLIVPIGTTPLIMQGYGMTLLPQDREKTITLETFFATAAGGNNTLAMKVTATFGLPLDPNKGIQFEGTLVVGGPDGPSLGTIKVKISRDLVTGELRIPSDGSPLPKEVLNANFNFKLDKEGFTGDGMATLYGVVDQTLDMALRFDGSGHLRAKQKFAIAGVNVEGSLLVEVRDQLREVELNADLNVDVDLKVFKASAVVAVHAKWPGQIEVAAEVAGIDAAKFQVDSLDDVTPPRIAEELLKHMDDVMQNIAAAAARWAEGKMELFAKWDEHWREELHNQAAKYGVDALRTGNPTADRILGGIAQDGKAVGGWSSDVYKKSGTEVSEFVEDPAKSLSQLPSNVGRTIADAPGAIADLIPGLGGGGGLGDLFGGGKDDEPSGPSPAEIRAAELHRQAEDRLKELVAAIPTVHVRRENKGVRQGTAQRYAAAEAGLDLRFANGAAASEGKGNASAGLSVFSCGFQTDIRIGAGERAARKTASDVKAAWVEFRPLIADDKAGTKPTARIFVDGLRDESGFNATMLARYELQQLVEKYLPEVEIDGPRFIEERYLAVKNGTDETLTVWIQAESLVREGQAKQWTWLPGKPGGEATDTIVLKPGERKLVPRREAPSKEAPSKEAHVRGRVARVWAQGESGEKYTTYRHKDLDLVPPNAQYNNRRVYYGEKLEEQTYEIKPTLGPKDYAQRRVQLKNATRDPLRVKLRYRAEDDGQIRWRELPEITLATGEVLAPRDVAGMQVVASRIQLWAESENRRFVKHEETPLWLVDESPAGRLYRAEKIGSYLYEFKPLGADVSPREATVTADRVPIKSGTDTIATVNSGTKFKVEDQNGKWFKVRVNVGGREKVGWLHERDLQVSGAAGPQAPPVQVRRTATVRHDNVPLKHGTATVATLRRGEQSAVHEEKSGWLRLEVERDGRQLRGWVQAKYLEVR